MIYDNSKKKLWKSTAFKRVHQLLAKPELKKYYPAAIALALVFVTGLSLAAQNNSVIEEPAISTTELAGRPTDYTQVSRGSINRGDTRLVSQVIEGEAAGEPFIGKVAVGAVIVNRTKSGQFPKNIRQVVYQPLAFEAVANGLYTRPTSQESVKAAEMALNGWDPTNGCLYYWNPQTAKSKWIWQKPIMMQLGRHVFAK